MWSWQFVIVELSIIIGGRFIGIVGLLYSLTLCKHKVKIQFREAVFVWFAGMIRGPIAFGLVLTIEDSVPGRSVIVSTTLAIVLITTFVFGTIMPMVQKILLGGLVQPAGKEAHAHA
jgi:NhaP-type Na+/H+ or K+/H+ antiporter